MMTGGTPIYGNPQIVTESSANHDESRVHRLEAGCFHQGTAREIVEGTWIVHGKYSINKRTPKMTVDMENITDSSTMFHSIVGYLVSPFSDKAM